MPSSSRTVIVHNHLFKNAGSTFDWSLQRNFGKGFLDHRDNAKMIQGASYLGPFIEKKPGLRAISSHHLKFPLPNIPDISLLPVIFLGHPIDRVGSVYTFEKNQDADTPGAIHARKFSFQEYVEWRMRPDVPISIRNFQTNRCLDVPANIKGFIGRPLNEDDLTVAIKRLQETQLLGLVEMYDASMVLFEEILRPYFPDIDLAYAIQNKTRNRAHSLKERIKNIFEQIDLETMDSLLIENHLDIKLYDYARNLLKERIDKIPDFSGKLSSFIKRCDHV